jgi:membrane-associated phospholipid phosphatase
MMRKNCLSLLLLVCAGLSRVSAQTPQSSCTPDCDGDVSWKLLVPNILHDQERIWLFPVKLAEGHDWIPTIAVAGTTSALLAADPYEGKYFHTTSSFSGFNSAFSSTGTEIGTIIAPVAIYGAGLITKDAKMQRTALFAGEAVANTEIISAVLKAITRRERPYNVPPGGNYRSTFFEAKGSPTSSGFPSGHTIAAFSIATVVAHRYRNHRWIPYAAYGAAALVGFSRLTVGAHFTSDVFAGAALGYAVTRFGVLQY